VEKYHIKENKEIQDWNQNFLNLSASSYTYSPVENEHSGALMQNSSQSWPHNLSLS